MGTNYYLIKNKCDCCGRFDRIHLEKSAAGWRFAASSQSRWDDEAWQELHRISSWDDFRELITADGVSVVNEYGEQVSVDWLISLIENKAEADAERFASEPRPGGGTGCATCLRAYGHKRH